MTDHAAVVQGMAAGVGGAVLALLGVGAQHLTIALFACSLGAVFAPPVSRLKGLALFSAAVAATAISASVLGPMLSEWWPVAAPHLWGKLVALGVGIWLHPVIQAGATIVPKIMNGAAERISRNGGGTQ